MNKFDLFWIALVIFCALGLNISKFLFKVESNPLWLSSNPELKEEMVKDKLWNLLQNEE